MLNNPTEIRAWQESLKRSGIAADLQVTGTLDASTIAATRKLQQMAISLELAAPDGARFQSFDDDGIVGSRTRDMLRQYTENSAVRTAANALWAPPPIAVASPVEFVAPVAPASAFAAFSGLSFASLSGSPLLGSILGNLPAPKPVASAPAVTPTLATLTAQVEGPLTITPEDIVRPADIDRVLAQTRMTREALQASLERSADTVNTLHPEMRAAVALGMRAEFLNGNPVVAVDGHRGREAQERARRKGFSNAGFGGSFHNFSLGADIVPVHPVTGMPYDYEDVPVREREAYAERVRSLRDRMNEFGLSMLSDVNDLCHFTFAPEETRRGERTVRDERGLHTEIATIQGHSGAGFVRAAGGEFVEGFLKIPEEHIAPRIRAATHALRAERNPPPPAIQPPERLVVAEADKVDLGDIAQNVLASGKHAANRLGNAVSGLLSRFA